MYVYRKCLTAYILYTIVYCVYIYIISCQVLSCHIVSYHIVSCYSIFASLYFGSETRCVQLFGKEKTMPSFGTAALLPSSPRVQSKLPAKPVRALVRKWSLQAATREGTTRTLTTEFATGKLKTYWVSAKSFTRNATLLCKLHRLRLKQRPRCRQWCRHGR